MSCSYDIICVDCSTAQVRRADAGLYDSNHSQREMVGILNYRGVLENAGPMFSDLASQWFADGGAPGQDRLGKVMRFFSAHIGHEVRLIDEYGMFYGEGKCNEHVWEPRPGGACDLAKDHEGPHHLIPAFAPWRTE